MGTGGEYLDEEDMVANRLLALGLTSQRTGKGPQ